MFAIRPEIPSDIPAREALLDLSFGEARFAKTCERLREGRLPADGLALVVVREGALAGTIRLWNVTAGPGRAALMLGPVPVAPELRGNGIGAKLVGEALARATLLGHRAVLLVGDAPYYGRFGFSREAAGGLWLPGPYAPERFLALALVPGALAGAGGLVSATGDAAGWPDLAALVAAAANGDRRFVDAA